MAYTTIANVIVPEVYLDYERGNLEHNLQKNALFQSGIVNYNPALNSLLAAGGKTFNMPFWKKSAISAKTPTPIDEGTTLTPENIVAGDQIVRRQYRELALGANDIARVLAGSSPMDAMASCIGDLWQNVRNKALFSSIIGMIADNITNDSGDLVKDITTAATTAFNFDDAVDAVAKLGMWGSELGVLAVHSRVYYNMQKADLVQTYKPSEVAAPGEYFGKMRIVVDDTLVNTETVGTSATSVYYSVFFKPGAFEYGEVIDEKSLQIGDNKLASGGQDYLVTRRDFAIHPVGWKWTENTVTADFPTDAELATAANWDRVVSDAKLCGFTVLKSLS